MRNTFVALGIAFAFVSGALGLGAQAPAYVEAASCSGTYVYDYSDYSDVACPITTSLNNLNIYKAIPTCPANPEGEACTGPCKIHSSTSMSGCVVQTDVYRCADAGGQAVSPSSCPAAAPITVTAALVANPTSIVRGEQSLLTWSSQNAHTCSSTDFDTGGLTSGSTIVTPQQSTTYKISCMREGGGTAQAQASVTVVDPANSEPDFTVSCRAHPTQAHIGEDVLWSSTVTGGEGAYTYEWSGTDGLSGSTNELFTEYLEPGLKTAALTVTYTPASAPLSAGVSCPTVSPPACSDGTLVSKGTDANGCSLGYECTEAPPPPAAPPAAVCPQVGWVTPVSACVGTWSPTYNTSGCQSGWQCFIGSTSTNGGSSIGAGVVPQILTPISLPSIDQALQQKIPEIQTVNGQVQGASTGPEGYKYLNVNGGLKLLGGIVPGVLNLTGAATATLAPTGNIVPHTEGELFAAGNPVKADMLAHGGVNFSETTFVNRTLAADQTTMNRVCEVLHGAGSTATNIGARGYSSCGNNGILQFNGTTWASISGCAGAHLSASFSCVVPTPAPEAGACTLLVNPTVVQLGQSAILSWVSNGLSSLTINNGIGSVTPITSGSRTITPVGIGTYAYTGNGDSSAVGTSYTVKSALPGFVAAMTADTAKYGVTYSTSFGTHADQVTLDHVCTSVFGAGASASNWDKTAFNSCGNNSMLTWTGTSWTLTNACSSNLKILHTLDCSVPATQTAPPVTCDNSSGILTVVQPPPAAQVQTVTVQCDNGVHITLPPPPQCSDGIDNDGDGNVDYPNDPACTGPDDDDEGGGGSTQCSDGIDNDGDGDADYPEDSGCSGPGDDDETDATPQCSDGIDNDNDGLADEEDPGCTSGGGTPGGPEGTYNPNDNSEAGGGAGGVAQCSDGVDNNGDGNIDFPDDPGCSGAGDNSESLEGAELTLSANPPLIKKNQACTLVVAALNVSSCSLTGPNFSRTFTAQGGIVNTTQVVTPELAQSTTFTLKCNGLDGNEKSKTVDCKVAPTFEEF